MMGHYIVFRTIASLEMDGGWSMYKGKKRGHCVPQRVK